jgi:hypothetical protein
VRIRHAGEPFKGMHEALVGVEIDWQLLDRTAIAAPLLAQAQSAWSGRVQSEYQSIQVMSRFLQEVLAAGDPLEVQAGAVMAIRDEIRHVALTCTVVERLGAAPLLPDPLEHREVAAFLALPPAQRALGTAITMLAINETVSVALIEDLRSRATHPVIRAVLEATLADEDAHGDFGWAYVEASLSRFDGEGRSYARACAESAVESLAEPARERALDMAPEMRSLERWPEPELAHLGLRSPEREALVILTAVAEEVMPRLKALDLA